MMLHTHAHSQHPTSRRVADMSTLLPVSYGGPTATPLLVHGAIVAPAAVAARKKKKKPRSRPKRGQRPLEFVDERHAPVKGGDDLGRIGGKTETGHRGENGGSWFTEQVPCPCPKSKLECKPQSIEMTRTKQGSRSLSHDEREADLAAARMRDRAEASHHHPPCRTPPWRIATAASGIVNFGQLFFWPGSSGAVHAFCCTEGMCKVV